MLASIFLAVVLTLAPGVSNKIAFSTHHCYLGTTYMGGKKLSIIIVYRIKGCFSFRLYIGVFCFMEHLVTCPSLALPHGLYAVAALTEVVFRSKIQKFKNFINRLHGVLNIVKK